MLVDRPVEHVVVLTLNRPDRLNPVGGELTEALTKIWPELNADPTVRVIMPTGAGRGFCSGAQAVATASPATLQTSLRSIWESLEYPLTESYYHAFGPLTAHWEHPDAQEGPRAFMEKRDPAWAE